MSKNWLNKSWKALSLTCVISLASTLLSSCGSPPSKGGKWGFIDKTGKIVIEPKFDSVAEYSVAQPEWPELVKEGNQWEYILPSGDKAFDKVFDAYLYQMAPSGADASSKMRQSLAYEFHEGKARVYMDGKPGYIDATGKITWQKPFDPRSIGTHYSEGLVEFVSKEGKYGFLDMQNNVAIQPKFEAVQPFSEGLAAAAVDGQTGFIDKTGEFIIDPEYKACGSFSEGLAIAQVENELGYIDRTGKMKIPPGFTEAREFSEGVAWICWPDESARPQYAYIDKIAKYTIDPKPEKREHGYVKFPFPEMRFSEGLALQEENGKFGYINKKGQWAIKPQFHYAGPFCKGLAAVQVDQ